MSSKQENEAAKPAPSEAPAKETPLVESKVAPAVPAVKVETKKAASKAEVKAPEVKEAPKVAVMPQTAPMAFHPIIFGSLATKLLATAAGNPSNQNWDAAFNFGSHGPANLGFGGRGRRGTGGQSASVSSAMSGSNNDITAYARNAGTDGNSLQVQWNKLGTTPFSHPGKTYVGGLPAFKVMNNNKDFVLIARDPGTQGNDITCALVNPGATHDLTVAVSGKAITVTLAYSSGITSTSQDIVTAINADPVAGLLVEAYLIEASGTASALAAQSLASGTDDATLTFVITKTDSSGAISMTGEELATALSRSNLVYATILDGDDGSGTVTVQTALTLSGGTDGQGTLETLGKNRTLLASMESNGLTTAHGHSKTTQKGFSPKRQRSIQNTTVAQDREIIQGKDHQEIQHQIQKGFGSRSF